MCLARLNLSQASVPSCPGLGYPFGRWPVPHLHLPCSGPCDHGGPVPQAAQRAAVVLLMHTSFDCNFSCSAGFLGSHLVDRLMEAGEEVICLDNYFTGRKANIAHWIGHPRFELIRHDVTEPIKLEVDRIWHLACPASPVHYQFNPIKTAKTSFLVKYVFFTGM